MQHIKACLSTHLDPPNSLHTEPTKSTVDATLHLTLSQLENKDAYAGPLCVDFSLAFNTIIPRQLVGKLQVDTGTCNWILNVLRQRQQMVRVGSQTSW